MPSSSSRVACGLACVAFILLVAVLVEAFTSPGWDAFLLGMAAYWAVLSAIAAAAAAGVVRARKLLVLVLWLGGLWCAYSLIFLAVLIATGRGPVPLNWLKSVTVPALIYLVALVVLSGLAMFLGSKGRNVPGAAAQTP
jgi:hypothetical protein